MVALVENLAFTRDMPLHGRAQNHRYRSGVSDCSKCNCEASLRRATYDECNRLESCSKDPIGYYSDINLYRYCDGSPIVLVDPTGLDWLDNAANYSAGIADSMTMGVHGWVRSALGINDGIDADSHWYVAGEATEIVVETTLTLGAAASRHVARRVVREVVEGGARTAYRRKHKIVGGIIHHATPIKGHPGGIPAYFPLPYKFAARGAWNMQYVSNVAQHAAMHRRLRRQEAWLRRFNLTQPIRNGGNLLIQHLLDIGPNNMHNSTSMLPVVTTQVNFIGTKTIFYNSCNPDPDPFDYAASGLFTEFGIDYFNLRNRRN